MSHSDESPQPSSASTSMWNGWAFGMFTGLSILVLVIAVFLSYTRTAVAIVEQDSIHAGQRACITALRNCHDGRFVPRICAMRDRLGMENDEGAPVYGPGNLSCARANWLDTNYCEAAKDACATYHVTIPPLD